MKYLLSIPLAILSLGQTHAEEPMFPEEGQGHGARVVSILTEGAKVEDAQGKLSTTVKLMNQVMDPELTKAAARLAEAKSNWDAALQAQNLVLSLAIERVKPDISSMIESGTLENPRFTRGSDFVQLTEKFQTQLDSLQRRTRDSHTEYLKAQANFEALKSAQAEIYKKVAGEVLNTLYPLSSGTNSLHSADLMKAVPTAEKTGNTKTFIDRSDFNDQSDK